MEDAYWEEYRRNHVSGGKRTNIRRVKLNGEDVFGESFPGGWWEGYGKDTSCGFEGPWEDIVAFAHEVLKRDAEMKEEAN